MKFLDLECKTNEEKEGLLSFERGAELSVRGVIYIEDISHALYGENKDKARIIIKALGAKGKRGEIVYFGYPCEDAINEKYMYLKGLPVVIGGKWNHFGGKWNINASGLSLTQDYTIEDFDFGDKNISDYEEIFWGLVGEIRDPVIKSIIEKLKTWDVNYYEKLKVYPAGLTMHDVGRGGLLKHKTKMLKTAKLITETYGGDFDIVGTAIIFHDVGKVFELDIENKTYTSIGKLKGHALMSYEIFKKLSEDSNIDADKKLNIEHCIISHAGEMEYGAVSKPATLEAYITNLCDKVDTVITSWLENKSDTEEDGYARSLGRPVITDEALSRVTNNKDYRDVL